MQMQVIQSEKMSSLGQLVAGIAHEINNPVSFIHGNLDHLNEQARALLQGIVLYEDLCKKDRLDLDAEVRTRLEELDLDFIKTDLPKILGSMQVGTQRIQQIVLSLRNFATYGRGRIQDCRSA